VDPAVSAVYRWSECGRIEATPTRPRYAIYALDGSVLSVDELGGILRNATDELSSRILAEPSPGATWTYEVGLALSSDGKRLLRWHDAELDVYATNDGAAIGASSDPLMHWAHIDLSRTACNADHGFSFSADGEQIIGQGATSVCAWAARGGSPSTTVQLPATPADPRPLVVAGMGSGQAPLRVLHERTLRTYDAAGKLVGDIDLRPLLPEDAQVMAAFSPDATTLLVAASPLSGSAWRLVAVDAASGAERWNHAVNLMDEYPRSMTFSNDDYLLLGGAQVYRVDSGEIVRNDQLTFPVSTALGPGGRTKLLVGELVEEWDLDAGKATRFYGSHTTGVRAIDVSDDGRYLTSHGNWAVLWGLAANFSASRPLSQGSGADSSWNVAIAPDGSSFVASGDNIALFHRDGRFQRGDIPSSSAGLVSCLSPDWSFSPDGLLLAGNHYGPAVEVRAASDFSLVAEVPATNCGGGVAFSRDGSRFVTASLELFETGSFRKLWDRSASKPSGSFDAESAVVFSPDGREVVVTRCRESLSACSSELYAAEDGASRGPLPALSRDRVRYSPEGHWLVSGGRLLHLPTQAIREYATDATAAVFVANGDIIAGMADGSLVRYCRSDN
jgi:hypothetical protein